MAILLTESAARRITQVLSESGQNALAVRLEVQGGGCSGYQYKFSFAEAFDEKAEVLVERDGAKLLIDKTSLDLLEGCEVDYTDSLMESAFRVNNPNAASSCGCGTSFSLKD